MHDGEPTKGSVDVDGYELCYVEEGKGEPVVLVHGSNSDSRIWDEHRAVLSKYARIVTPTQRYFGTGHWPDDGRGFGMQRNADDLGVLIEKLEIAPVSLIGWSWGGGVCLALAVQRPDLIRRMYLYEPALATFVANEKTAELAQDDRVAMSAVAAQFAAAGKFADSVRAFMDGVNNYPGTFDSLPARIQTLMTENARMLPLLFAGPPPPAVTKQDLEQLDVPIFISAGEGTRLFYSLATSTAASLLPTASFQVIENARHLWPVQEPQGFSRRVIEAFGWNN